MLRKLFGPSRDEIWRQLVAQIGPRAQIVDGGFWKDDKVQVSYGEWVITLDTYSVSTGKTTMVFTRLRAPYVNPDRFRFEIARKGLFSEVAAFFGAQDVVIGEPEFDRDFIIKGTSDAKLRALFANPRLRALLSAQPQVKFTVQDNEGLFGPTFPPDTDQLSFVALGVIKDVEQLKQLFDLFAETLDQLCLIGSAYDHAPGLKH